MPILRICVPAKVHTNTKFTMSLLACVDKVKPVTGYTPDVRFLCGKSNIDQARSMMCTDFYRESKDDDLMLFIDSDHIFTVDDIKNVIALGADVGCGIYPNAIGKPTTHFMDPPAFIAGTDNRLRMAGTGFMLIRRPILTKILTEILEPEGIPHARIGPPPYDKVIPFFKQRIIESEISPGNRDWIGEDYTFCWCARKVGGVIRGFFTRTLGHEVPNIRVFYPECPATEKGPIIRQELPLTATATATPTSIPTNTVSFPISNDSAEQLSRLYRNSPAVASSSATVAPTAATQIEKNREIVYFCGLSRVKFGPNTTKLGGSEQAVINLTRNWAKTGKYNVSVYGNVEEGEYDGVKYIHVTKFDINKTYDTLILWRGFGLSILPVAKAKTLLVDLHDATDPRMLPTEHLHKVAKFMVKSNWHKSNWTHIPEDKYVVQKNGVDVELYSRQDYKTLERHNDWLCYTSCYTRGLLETLRNVWPIIVSNNPSAQYHICYGDDLIQDPALKNAIRDAMKQPGIIDHGRLSAEEVAKLRHQCAMHLYLCTVPQVEIDCLSVRESLMAGCIPVTFTEGVFTERTVINVPGTHNQLQSYQMAAGAVSKIIQNNTILDNMRNLPVNETRWAEVAEEWEKVF